MKTLNNYIKEAIKVNHEAAFSEIIHMDASQWNEWKSSKQEQDIIVYEDPKNSNICNIYLNTAIETEVEEKCVLAEEIGHYETGIIKTKLNDSKHSF